MNGLASSPEQAEVGVDLCTHLEILPRFWAGFFLHLLPGACQACQLVSRYHIKYQNII